MALKGGTLFGHSASNSLGILGFYSSEAVPETLPSCPETTINCKDRPACGGRCSALPATADLRVGWGGERLPARCCHVSLPGRRCRDNLRPSLPEVTKNNNSPNVRRALRFPWLLFCPRLVGDLLLRKPAILMACDFGNLSTSFS